MKKTFEMNFAGRKLVVETGEVAKQADASILVRYGDTVVLSTVVVSKNVNLLSDFFPLMVLYQEKLYSVGKIPGGFIKREGRPSEAATLAARMIDRPMRPLFPEDFRNEVQIVNTVLSVDPDNSPELAALLGSSLAVSVSKIPFNGPVAGVKVGRVDGKLIINPNTEESEKSDIDLDIIVTPGLTIASGVLIAQFVGPAVGGFMDWFAGLVKTATELQPFIMGILVSALIGIALTLPISSAAICIALSLDGLAGGAATAGCCAQMIGFAVMSYRENKVGGLLAQGLGTSMLQMGNIVRNPKIWIGPTLISMITGPLATMVFHMENIPAGSGMGTCGLVGPIGVFTAMGNTPGTWIGIFVICFFLPALLGWIFGIWFRSIGWIQDGDMKLDL